MPTAGVIRVLPGREVRVGPVEDLLRTTLPWTEAHLLKPRQLAGPPMEMQAGQCWKVAVPKLALVVEERADRAEPYLWAPTKPPMVVPRGTVALDANSI